MLFAFLMLFSHKPCRYWELRAPTVQVCGRRLRPRHCGIGMRCGPLLELRRHARKWYWRRLIRYRVPVLVEVVVRFWYSTTCVESEKTLQHALLNHVAEHVHS